MRQTLKYFLLFLASQNSIQVFMCGNGFQFHASLQTQQTTKLWPLKQSTFSPFDKNFNFFRHPLLKSAEVRSFVCMQIIFSNWKLLRTMQMLNRSLGTCHRDLFFSRFILFKVITRCYASLKIFVRNWTFSSLSPRHVAFFIPFQCYCLFYINFNSLTIFYFPLLPAAEKGHWMDQNGGRELTH